ncbi:Pleiotropic regulator of exopolysaccharide synthesis competence and biofilm formation Ftr XRE family [Lactococcus lactis subsp. lactis]|uniref:XRE family transcriptional regulator n=1 Tax=Lactococcus lactis TaxID=1358 RepID=UPI00071CC17D|nr:XRE family transcriptional regulator [Lactococcus lactis]KST87997.1 Pleiotropic regulator of exopolysaccharide synthesis competence and biofilm formation Ftr XRE family [Lactococcus lactis subsp. lactis]
MKLSERLKQLRLENNLTQTQVANRLHITYQQYQKWENNYRKPQINSLEKLADVFNVPISYLIDEKETQQFSEFEQIFKNLPEAYQKKAIACIKLIFENYQKEQQNSDLYTYDVYNLLLTDKEIPKGAKLGHVSVYWDKKVDYDWAIWIKGDSMIPEYYNGEVALIKNQTHIDFEGQVCAVNYEGNTYIKKIYYQKTGLKMESINKNYHDFFLNWDEKPRIVGKVVEAFTPIKENF